ARLAWLPCQGPFPTATRFAHTHARRHGQPRLRIVAWMSAPLLGRDIRGRQSRMSPSRVKNAIWHLSAEARPRRQAAVRAKADAGYELPALKLTPMGVTHSALSDARERN